MERRFDLRIPKFIILFLFASFPFLSHAQDTSSGASAGAAPSAASSIQTTPSQTPAPTDKKKPRKVWTNEDVSSVKGGISVVGDPDKSSSEPDSKKSSASTAGKDLRQQQIENYRSQIQQLQTQIDDVDKHISQLKNFKG